MSNNIAGGLACLLFCVELTVGTSAVFGEHFLQQGEEHFALGIAEILQQTFFVQTDLAFQFAQQSATGCCQANGIGPAVM